MCYLVRLYLSFLLRIPCEALSGYDAKKVAAEEKGGKCSRESSRGLAQLSKPLCSQQIDDNSEPFCTRSSPGADKRGSPAEGLANNQDPVRRKIRFFRKGGSGQEEEIVATLAALIPFGATTALLILCTKPPAPRPPVSSSFLFSLYVFLPEKARPTWRPSQVELIRLWLIVTQSNGQIAIDWEVDDDDCLYMASLVLPLAFSVV
ncbi:hypothetical protein ACOMHN_027830 [Nucella lapillus]